MIAQLSGKIIYKSPSTSVIDCHGVGYEVFHSPFTAERMKSETVSLFIHTNVREDAFQLFGFFTAQERSLFRELIRVNGVGPKLALAILSGISFEELLSALASKDLSRLQKIPGIGKKTAERLSIELADRLKELEGANLTLDAFAQPSDRSSELESVLLNLGYQRPEIARIVKILKSKTENFGEISLEELVRLSLRELSQVKSV